MSLKIGKKVKSSIIDQTLDKIKKDAKENPFKIWVYVIIFSLPLGPFALLLYFSAIKIYSRMKDKNESSTI